MKKLTYGRLILLTVLCFAVLSLLPKQAVSAAATDTVKVASVEYYNENIVVFNNSNTKFYFAAEVDAAKGNWDVMPVEEDSDFTTIDISWLSSTIDNVVVIKGDDDQQPARIFLNEKPQKLEVAINYSNIDKLPNDSTIGPLVNIMSTVGNGSNPVTIDDLEWRKGEAGQWMSTQSLTVGKLEQFLVKGVDLYFRIRALDDTVDITRTLNGVTSGFNVNDDRLTQGYAGGLEELDDRYKLVYGEDFPDGTQGRRASSEIKLKITKKLPAMIYDIDGEEFNAEIKYGKEYRVTVTYPDDNNNATPEVVKTDWVQVVDRSVRSIPLATLLSSFPARKDAQGNNIIYDGITTGFPEMYIEVRDYATNKYASSKTTEIPLDAQETITEKIVEETVPANAIENKDSKIYVTYNGDKNLIVTVPLATLKFPYEYTVVKKGEEYDNEHAVWTSITKGTGIKILASRAVDDGTLYVRRKEIKSKEATRTSAAVSYKLASTVAALDIWYPSMPVVTKDNVTYVKGISSNVKITIQKLTDVNKIPFETEVESIKLGIKVIDFKVLNNTASTLELVLDDDDLTSMANCTGKTLTIKFKKGTIDKTSFKITIKNPTPAGALTATLEKGTDPAKIKVTMFSTLGKDNKFVYAFSNDVVTGVVTEAEFKVSSSEFKSAEEITVPAGSQCITIYELNPENHVIRFISIKLT